MANREAIAHLLRRATFGPRAEEVDAGEKAGYEATVKALFDTSAPDAGAARTPVPQLAADPYLGLGKSPTREQQQQARQQRQDQVRSVTLWWLDRMVAADHQAPEKLAFFWHGHWATSVEKVKSGTLMLQQQQTLFRTALGDLGTQVKTMLRDPALIIWLDGQKNTVQAPNENLARELMELFTLGIGHYSEDDVKAGARALTGWVVDLKTGAATLNPKRHDDRDKTILGRTGAFDADGFADILLDQPAHAEFVARRMWFRYATDQPMPDTTLRKANSQQATQTLQAILTDEAFTSTAGQLVKQPVEWAVGAMRQLDIRPGQLAADQQRQLLATLDQLGQLPLQPPSVGGWPAGTAWLTTSSTQVRLRAAQLLAGRASQPTIDRLSAVPAGQRVEALQRLLVVDAFTTRTKEVLQAVASQPRQLIALGLASPEYTVS